MNEAIIQAAKKYDVLIRDVNYLDQEADIPLDTFILFYMDDPLEFGQAYRVRLIKRHDKGVINSFGRSSYIERVGADSFFSESMKGMNDKIKGDL